MRPFRREKVASVVQQVVGEGIAYRLNDPRVAPFTTVTRVAVTGDLLVAKVYLSIQGDEATERRTLTAVRHARGYLQRMVAEHLPIRQCPELRFEMDEVAKGARRTMELLAENRRRQPELYDPPEGAAAVEENSQGTPATTGDGSTGDPPPASDGGEE